ncbi:ABC transporter substrate-binding protein [Bradyrhizobium sp. AUGA SZCCT0222]|uniref:ABC transporter substrate-binding protein n=1 Tax=Bradyrhizobium sp. AUGA SZCCT0222 TaxID=2807668 RepID=UPI001BA67E27|nr:ABC transporter substrate-binding protein [Bradyrhizobium sp. AUGA SZCCT0222]MBR1266503.1 ABC transporter substrate-binding protein [Bradyrhizobium sp. AUGA SZCCT0222]
MKRREFIRLVGGVAASWPMAARAQQRIPIVGFVGFANADVDAVTVGAFRKALVELGHVEGRTIIVNARSANGDVARGHAMIDELVALPVNVFLSPGQAAARAIVRKTNIPVVAVALPAVQSDPELFQSLARPGGTVTGFSAFGEEISAKRIEMLKEIEPGLKKIGVMHNATDPTFSAWGSQTMADARSAGIEPVRLGLSAPSAVQLTEQIRKLADDGGTAMIVIRDFLTVAMMDDICRIAADLRIAVIGEHAEIARAGALFSYGADLADLFRRAAGYVDNILKGQKPAEMPIQLPTRFELIANVRVARTLGLTFPPTILVLADQLIE